MNKGLFKGSSDTQPNKGLSSGDVSLSLIPQKPSDYISMDAPIRGSRNTLIGEVKFNSFAAYYLFPKLSDPASLPPSIGRSVAFSPDGQFMAVAHNNSPFITIYSMSGTTFTKLSNPAPLPINTGYGVAFSPNGQFMAVAHTTSPFITIYSISGTTFTKLTNPSSLPAGIGYGVAFDTNSKKLAVAHATSPFVTIYDIRRSTNLDSYPIDLDTSIKISVKT